MAWALRAGTPATGASSTASTATVTLGAAVSINDRIIVGVEVEGSNASPHVTGVADGLGNVYALDKAISAADPSNPGFTGDTETWSAPVTVAGTPTITVTLNQAPTSGGSRASAAAFSGLNTSATPVDVSASATGTTTSLASGNTPATTGANELVVGVGGDDGFNQTPFTGTGGLTLDTSGASDTVAEVAFGHKDSGASGSAVSATMTVNANAGANLWGMLCVVYKLAAVAAAGAVVLRAIQKPAVLRRRPQLVKLLPPPPAPGQMPVVSYAYSPN